MNLKMRIKKKKEGEKNGRNLIEEGRKLCVPKVGGVRRWEPSKKDSASNGREREVL